MPEGALAGEFSVATACWRSDRTSIQFVRGRPGLARPDRDTWRRRRGVPEAKRNVLSRPHSPGGFLQVPSPSHETRMRREWLRSACGLSQDQEPRGRPASVKILESLMDARWLFSEARATANEVNNRWSDRSTAQSAARLFFDVGDDLGRHGVDLLIGKRAFDRLQGQPDRNGLLVCA